MNNVLFTEEQIQARVKEVAAAIFADYQNKQSEGIIVVGVLRGAAIYLADLVRNLGLDVLIDFVEVSSYKDEVKSSGKIELEKDVFLDVKGKHILIVEDIIDSGLTVKFLIEHFKKREAASVDVSAVVDKNISGLELNKNYICFDCPNKFVLGYGLDYAQKYRNLPYIKFLDI